MANPGFQTINFGFQAVGEFGFQEEPGGQVITPPVVGGSGKDRQRRNEIIEIEGKRWSVPKEQVAEFLARFQPKEAPFVEIQTIHSNELPITFTTSTGKVIKTTQEALKDDIGIILIMAALTDEDFYED